MKVLYIEARKKKENAELNKGILEKLPKEFFLAYSIQYESQANRIKKQLESNGFKIRGLAQVLGCTELKISSPILLIGSGRFHALNLAIQSNYPVYVYNDGTINRVEENEIIALKKKKQGNISKFLSAEKVGILFSTKSGQYNPEKEIIEKLMEKFPEKRFFFFISDNINTAEFENFDIDFWLNTACPGLANDSTKIENIVDIFNVLMV